MSKKRQPATFDRVGTPKAEIATFTRDYAAGQVIASHFHERDQLVYASRGVMTVRTEWGTWVVPTQRSVWIPARVAHTITMSGNVAMRTLYFKPGMARSLPRNCCVLNVSRLLSELILCACGFAKLSRRVARERHLIDVIVDQLRTIQTVPLQLPRVTDARALRVADALENHPADGRTVAQICRAAGAGTRTVERLFKEELGMTLGRWRQQVRLMKAMRAIGEGSTITRAAVEAGYSTPSAFTVAFRKSLGTTPRLYFQDAHGGDAGRGKRG